MSKHEATPTLVDAHPLAYPTLSDASRPENMPPVETETVIMEPSQQDCQEQVCALLQVLDLLSKLASMETAAYTSTMQSSVRDDGAFALQHRLDILQQQWKLEDTSVPKLLQSIHRLHSHLNQFQSDAHHHTLEVQAFQERNLASLVRIRQLEKAVQKLHKKQQKLQQKLDQKNKERKSIVKHVKDYVKHVKKQDEVDEQRVAHQLRAHERLMRLETSLQQQNSLSGGNGANRSRCSSRDTIFSDVDMAALYPFEDDLDDGHSVSSSASSASTIGSLVTDEGVATVRYSPRLFDSPLGEPRAASPSQSSYEYQLVFPKGTKIGLQFHKVPLYKPKKGTLNDAFMHNENDISDHGDASKMTPQKESSFSMHFNLDSLLGKHNSLEEDGYGFLVCGHHGFVSQFNTRPTLGARLVKVNGETIGVCTLDQIRDATRSNNEDTFTMTFRNEPLNKKQKDILEKAIKAADNQLYEEDHQGERNNMQNFEKSCADIELEDGTIEIHEETGSRPRLPSNSYTKPESNVGNRIGSEPGTPGDSTQDKGNRSRLSSFLQMSSNGSSGDELPPPPPTHVYSDRIKSDTPLKEYISQDPETPPAEKFKKSMKVMGSKFKSLF